MGSCAKYFDLVALCANLNEMLFCLAVSMALRNVIHVCMFLSSLFFKLLELSLAVSESFTVCLEATSFLVYSVL